MPTRRLNDKKRMAIQADLNSGLTQSAIAKKHGVSSGTVSNTKLGLVKSTKEEIDPTNKKILQLEAQNLVLKDDINRIRQAYKATQRVNSIFEALVEELHKVVTPMSPLPKIRKYNGKKKLIRESVVVLLSDEHADQIVLPHQVGNLERKNFPITLRRAEEFVDTLVKFTQKTLSNYKFDRLWILANGDHVSGEIHNAKDHSEYRNSFRNSLATGQMQALMFRDLAPYFREIKVIYVPGNHCLLYTSPSPRD